MSARRRVWRCESAEPCRFLVRRAVDFCVFASRFAALSPAPLDGNDQVPLAQPQRQLHRLGQPGAKLRAGHQPVDDDFDVVPHLPVEPQIVAQPHDPAIDPGADEALLQQVVEQVAILALLAADQRREHQEPRAGRQAPRSGR